MGDIRRRRISTLPRSLAALTRATQGRIAGAGERAKLGACGTARTLCATRSARASGQKEDACAGWPRVRSMSGQLKALRRSERRSMRARL